MGHCFGPIKGSTNCTLQGKKQGLIHVRGNVVIDAKKNKFQPVYVVVDQALLWYYNKEHLPENVSNSLTTLFV